MVMGGMDDENEYDNDSEEGEVDNLIAYHTIPYHVMSD